MREQVIRVRNERDPDKKEEMISSYAFDAMYAIQEGIDTISLKSQGFGINLCAELALEISKRLKHQSIPVKMKIFLNSRFPNEPRRGKGKPTRDSMQNPKIISFLDVKFQFTEKK
jgi:hypothetical protein